jgi:prephenate dehydrogenase
MTGSEQSGIESARQELFEDCYYILTPTDETDPGSLERLHRFLTNLGARVNTLDPQSHDRAMAAVSHVPHLVAQLLMDMAAREREHTKSVFKLAAGGFRDMTRIAASDTRLWLDICEENSEFIAARLRELMADISGLVDAVESGDSGELAERFERARLERLELSTRGSRDPGEMFELRIAVPDEPGVISRITTATGAVGVNIEDIGLVHPLEGEKGILTLRVKGEEQARLASEAALSLGFKAGIRGV